MNQMFEEKYLKYKQKYLSLKNNKRGGSNCAVCSNMMGGVILKTLNYKRDEVVLPESFDIGNVISFNGTLSYKEKTVGQAIVLYYISDVIGDKFRPRSNTRGPSLTGELDPTSEEAIAAAKASTVPNLIVKIVVTIVLFDMTVYKFENESVPLSLVAASDRTLAPYIVNTTLSLKKSSNNEKDLTMNYVIEDGKGTFTITP